MRRRSHFWLNIEAGLIFLVAATLDCVSPYGFHSMGISPRKQNDIKIASPRDGPYGNEANEIPGWKKFHFWKRKRNYWSEDNPYSGQNLLDDQLNMFDLNSEKSLNEPQNYDAFNLVNSRSQNDIFDPELVYNDIKPEPELSSSGLGYWNLRKILLATGDDDLPTGIPSGEKKEGFAKPGDGCQKSISLKGTTGCIFEEDCNDCYGFVFHCENNFCAPGPRPAGGLEAFNLER